MTTDTPTQFATSPTKLASARAYKEKNREHLREWQLAYNAARYADPARREKKLQQDAESRRRHAESGKEYDRARDREKQRARQQIRERIYDGRLVRGACVICLAPNAEAHHEDYAKPLCIHWLCSQHHKDIHRGLLNVSSIPALDVTTPTRRKGKT